MFTTPQRVTVVPSGPPSSPRLLLSAARAGRTVLDGGWWPRSWDPVAELPGLVLALADRFGPIRQVLLNNLTWEGRFRRLAVGAEVVRMGWFASLDPAVLVAIADRGGQIDLLVVPPLTSPVAAERAMSAAADPSNIRRAPDLLAAISAAAADVEDAGDENAVWDNEGGHIADSRLTGPPTRLAIAHSS